MDRYGNLSDDGEVDHSFFDSDADEEASKGDCHASGLSKQKYNGGTDLEVRVGASAKEQVLDKEEPKSEATVQKRLYDDETTVSSSSVASSRPGSAKSDRSFVQSLKMEATIPAGIPKIRREFEDNYYTDEENSSDEESHNSRPKSVKQTNIGKKSTRKNSKDVASSTSSSDAEYSDDRTSKSSYLSSKERGPQVALRSPERKSSKTSVKELRDYAEESEDTVTDVTPLSTPDISPIQSFDLAVTSELLKSKIKRQENISKEIYDPEFDQKGNQKALQDAMDLNQLLKAFMHLDKKEQRNLTVEHPALKKNYSFSTEEVRHIDRENQRLLRELTRQTSKPRSKKPTTNPIRQYHSTLNRQKEQERIERENIAFLKRLDSVKPTVGMTRSEQLMDYQRHAGYLSSTATSPRPGKASLNRLSPSSSGGRSRLSSASSHRSDSTASSAALLRPTKPSNIRAAWM
ncbi:hypothetical protein FKM82_001110 [Ascaphus truei]